MPDTEWDYDLLWEKSRLFMLRAQKEDRESAMFGFWASLALETLARATLASVHPALLADPREGENILYAFGFGDTKSPRSIQMSTVVKRCRVMVPEFTEEEGKFVTALADRRNAELHSGKPAFEDFPTRMWLARFYRVIAILLTFQAKDLVTFLGTEEARAANEMIEATSVELRAEVFAEIADRKQEFEREPAQTPVALFALPDGLERKSEVCPACGNDAFIFGEVISAGEPRADDEEIVRALTVLPTRFVCRHCHLTIEGHARLHAAGLGGQFTTEERHDPAEYYGIEFDIADYMEPDYGND